MQVDAFYQAIAAGGQDNGAPGIRPTNLIMQPLSWIQIIMSRQSVTKNKNRKKNVSKKKS